MTYDAWFEAHATKHEKVLQKLLLKGMSEDEIIAYFRFENMLRHEPDFCDLYKTQTKCHDTTALNCYLCACPNFRFFSQPKQEAKQMIHSICSIDSKDGGRFIHENNVHQDCSGCLIPHQEAYIKANFAINWKKIMQGCPQD